VNFRSPLDYRGAGVLSITPFRRLWIALSLSSLGDWLSLVALSTLAVKLGGTSNGAYAVSGVWLTSLLPALLFGPFAGAVADKFDRRLNMIIGDVIRALLYLTIPLNLTFGFANQLTWLYVVQFLASCASLFWTPAKDASVPNLVPADKLEQANQLSLFSTYGTAPVAGLLFTMLALISRALSANQYDLALYFNAATFIVSALTIFMLRELRRRSRETISTPSVLKLIAEGWRFLGETRVVRGIVLGMTGAFAAGGVVVGLGQLYITDTLKGGGAGWGAVFAAIFFGLAIGMILGLRVLRGFSRRRLFGLSIMFAALPLALIALIPSLVLTVALTVVLGACAGVAYVTGYTVIGLEVDNETRGRTFAFLQSAIRVILFAVIAIAPTVAGAVNALARAVGGPNLHVGSADYRNVGYNVVMLIAAGIAVALGRMSYRQMDDRNGVPLLADLGSPFRPRRLVPLPCELGVDEQLELGAPARDVVSEVVELLASTRLVVRDHEHGAVEQSHAVDPRVRGDLHLADAHGTVRVAVASARQAKLDGEEFLVVAFFLEEPLELEFDAPPLDGPPRRGAVGVLSLVAVEFLVRDALERFEASGLVVLHALLAVALEDPVDQRANARGRGLEQLLGLLELL